MTSQAFDRTYHEGLVDGFKTAASYDASVPTVIGALTKLMPRNKVVGETDQVKLQHVLDSDYTFIAYRFNDGAFYSVPATTWWSVGVAVDVKPNINKKTGKLELEARIFRSNGAVNPQIRVMGPECYFIDPKDNDAAKAAFKSEHVYYIKPLEKLRLATKQYGFLPENPKKGQQQTEQQRQQQMWFLKSHTMCYNLAAERFMAFLSGTMKFNEIDKQASEQLQSLVTARRLDTLKKRKPAFEVEHPHQENHYLKKRGHDDDEAGETLSRKQHKMNYSG